MVVGLQVQILENISKDVCGIRDLIKLMPHRNETIVNTVREMEDRGLIKTSPMSTGRRGRPKTQMIITELGRNYLAAYRRLEKTGLQASPADFLKAKRDGEYAARLVDRGVDPIQAFMELNAFVNVSRDAS
jgi:DNA-binding PadR family transcriptional regulator